MKTSFTIGQLVESLYALANSRDNKTKVIQVSECLSKILRRISGAERKRLQKILKGLTP